MDEKTVNDCTIFKVVHGSRAYGTHLPDSDYDEKGICIPKDLKYYFGFQSFEQKDSGWSDGADRQIYDLRKFVRLAAKCNPNIIEVLFVDPSDILVYKPEFSVIYDNRNLFLSRLAAKTFVGYAHSEMRKVQNKIDAGEHIKWKHASHLLRLLRMGKEIVSEGVVRVKRPDAEELLDVRLGKRKWIDISKEADDLIQKINKCEEKSPLPSRPNMKYIENLLEYTYNISLPWLDISLA